MFNATFNNISVISWWSVLLVEETGVPRANLQPAARHWHTLSHKVVSSTPHTTRYSNSQIQALTGQVVLSPITRWSLVVLFFSLIIVLSVLLHFTASDCHPGILKFSCLHWWIVRFLIVEFIPRGVWLQFVIYKHMIFSLQYRVSCNWAVYKIMLMTNSWYWTK